MGLANLRTNRLGVLGLGTCCNARTRTYHPYPSQQKSEGFGLNQKEHKTQ